MVTTVKPEIAKAWKAAMDALQSAPATRSTQTKLSDVDGEVLTVKGARLTKTRKGFDALALDVAREAGGETFTLTGIPPKYAKMLMAGPVMEYLALEERPDVFVTFSYSAPDEGSKRGRWGFDLDMGEPE